MDTTKRRRLRPVPLFILAAGLLMGAVVMFLWNAILPEVTGVKPLTYWKAVGLLALCRILFGNFRGGAPNRGRGWGRQHFNNSDSSDDHPFSRHRWRNKWKAMNDEERAKFREEMRKRCFRPPGRP